MTEVLVAILGVGFVALFTVRNFFVQLMAIKLLIDVVVILAACSHGKIQSAFDAQVISFFIASLGITLFFVLLASGVKRFSRSDSLSLETTDE